MTNVCLFFKIFLKKFPYFSKPQIFPIIAFSLRLIINECHTPFCHCEERQRRGNLFLLSYRPSVASGAYLPLVIARSDSDAAIFPLFCHCERSAAISYSRRDSHATLRSAQNDSGRAFVIPSAGDSRSRAYLLSIHASTYYNSPKKPLWNYCFFLQIVV